MDTFPLVVCTIIITGVISFISFLYYEKWKKEKEANDVWSSLSRIYMDDYLKALKGTDWKLAIELGLKSSCYLGRIEGYSDDLRYYMATQSLQTVLTKVLDEMKVDDRVTEEDLKGIFKKVTYMDLLLAPKEPNNQ
jgi:hypothetical protein